MGGIWRLLLGMLAGASMAIAAEENAKTSTVNVPLLVTAIVIFVLAVIVDLWIEKRKKRSVISVVRNIKTEHVLTVLSVASIFLLILGIFNPARVFPLYFRGLRFEYLFDALIRHGGLLPVWILLLPSLGIYATRRFGWWKLLGGAAGLAIVAASLTWMPRVI